MIDLGVSKLALIGVVALIVIGPEKLPRVARLVGTFLGKAQRYVADVKAEVNRSIELEELKKMKESVEGAAKNVEASIQSTASDFEKSWQDATQAYDSPPTDISNSISLAEIGQPIEFFYKNPGKKWRLRRQVMPQWYKARSNVRTRVQSGAARVARFRPK
jgi:sec-independent protein translocase protein TatB